MIAGRAGLVVEVRGGVEQFRDDDRGYLNWVAAHGHGYVSNIQRSLNPAGARMHHANCYTISGQPPRGRDVDRRSSQRRWARSTGGRWSGLA